MPTRSLLLASLLLFFSPVSAPLHAAEKTPHYLCEKTRSLRNLLEQRWVNYEFPLKVYLPPAPGGILADPNMPYLAVQEAFKMWQRGWGGLSIQYVQTPPPDGITIQWSYAVIRNHWEMWKETNAPTLFFDLAHQVRHKNTVAVPLAAHPQIGYLTPAAQPLNRIEIRDITAHKIGHALGLHHSSDPQDMMSDENHLLSSSHREKQISARDVRTLYMLYSMPYSQKQHPCPGQMGR